MITFSFTSFIFPASLSMYYMHMFHDFVVVVMLLILWIVSYFMLYLVYFLDNAQSNFFFLGFSEMIFLESVWTMTPLVILAVVIYSSISTLYFTEVTLFMGWDISIMGHQWYWSYYMNSHHVMIDCYMVQDSCPMRLYDCDNHILVPYGIPVRILTSSGDVIHSWTIPALGVKIDCIPGRINQYSFTFLRPGIFFGQCSEICGVNHGFMPISMEVISIADLYYSK